MKFKSIISVDRLGCELMDCVKELLDIRDDNHFDRFKNSESASIQIIQDLITQGKLLHLLIELRLQRERLGWFGHYKFCKQLSTMETVLLTEISECGFEKKEIRELYKTLLIADSYISQERQSPAGKASKRNARYSRQIHESGPQACAKVAALYHRLANATVAGLGYEQPFKRGLWEKFREFINNLKQGFKDSDIVKITRSISRGKNTAMKARLYNSAAQYYLQTADSDNVVLKAKLILLHMNAEEYSPACQLIAELLPNYPNIPDVECYKKGESNSAVHKINLSLINELASLLEKAKPSCSSYEFCLHTVKNIPNIQQLLEASLLDQSISQSAGFILIQINTPAVEVAKPIHIEPRRTSSPRAGRNITNVVHFDPNCKADNISRTPIGTRRRDVSSLASLDKENGYSRGRAASNDSGQRRQQALGTAHTGHRSAPLGSYNFR